LTTFCRILAAQGKVSSAPCQDCGWGDNVAEGTTIMFTKTASLALLVMCLLGCQQINPRAMETREYAIEGMSCEGCVSTVTSALQAVSGVMSVEVSLKDKKATVVADSSHVSSQVVEDTVAKAGYKARLITTAGGRK
jgi:copper chaperone